LGLIFIVVWGESHHHTRTHAACPPGLVVVVGFAVLGFGFGFGFGPRLLIFLEKIASIFICWRPWSTIMCWFSSTFGSSRNYF